MKYDPQKHHRRSIRLKGYDYHDAGAYFVTICTKNRICLLDDPIIKGIVNDVWVALPLWFPSIILDEFMVMPNHIHLILWLTNVGVSLADTPNADTLAPNANDKKWVEINENDIRAVKNGTGAHKNRTRASLVPTAEKINLKPTLGDVVGEFKSLVFKVYLDWIKIHDTSRRAKFWQGNYYEHIIRNERELNAIRQYIIDNPKNWDLDRDNLENVKKFPPPERVDDYLQDIP